MDDQYLGTIVQESLTDDRILNDFKIVNFEVTTEDSATERWHMFKVLADEEIITKLSKYIKPQKWYANFWKQNEMLVVFPNKIFKFDKDDQDSWASAIEYGKSLNIPVEQLDFKIG